MSKKVYVKPYPKEFREQVVQLVQLGDRSALEVAREFEISVDSVRRWVQQAERDQGRLSMSNQNCALLTNENCTHLRGDPPRVWQTFPLRSDRA